MAADTRLPDITVRIRTRPASPVSADCCGRPGRPFLPAACPSGNRRRPGPVGGIRVVEKLTRLYPARWREWYGAEMEQLLEDLAQQSRSARLRLGADLLLGAVDARLSREFRAPRWQRPCERPGRKGRGDRLAADSRAYLREQRGVPLGW